MGTTFTKKEKKYFDFLLDMGFYFSSALSDKHNLEYIRILDGDNQFVSINKDGFIGTFMGKQIYDVCLVLDISTSAIGPVMECSIPQQFNHYYSEEGKKSIFKNYKKMIIDTLDNFEKHDHITGSMNEYIYNNYLSIAKESNFVPKTMDELNNFATNLRDIGQMSFCDYVYVVASLMIVFLINNTEIKNIYFSKDETACPKVLGIFLKPYPEKPILGFGVTILAKEYWDKKIEDLFYENKEFLDNYFKKSVGNK